MTATEASKLIQEVRKMDATARREYRKALARQLRGVRPSDRGLWVAVRRWAK